jgi:glycosyltransferase involved in cell wall biosynthesis
MAREHPTVCQVLHSLNVGGAEMLAARLARHLRDEFRFVFACLDELGPLGEQLRGEGFLVEVLGRKSGIDFSCVRRLAAFARREGTGIIHAHQYTPFFYCRAPGPLIARPPVLFNEHGRFFPDLPNRKRMLFNRMFLRGKDRVVAVGESVKQALIDNEGIPARRIDVIYNGVRLDDFAAGTELRGEVRRELGIDPAAPLAIQVARLDYLKDHCTAIRAAARVRKQLPGFRLLLVGEGPERPKIEAEIQALGLAEAVLMVGLRTDVRRLLAAADLFLLTSISEGIPVTLIEAMGARLPVVSTAVGGIKEVVIAEETGLLTKVGDDGALAAAMIRLITDPSLASKLGATGRSRAEQLFSEDEMHSKYVQLYEEMLPRNSRQPRDSVAPAAA